MYRRKHEIFYHYVKNALKFAIYTYLPVLALRNLCPILSTCCLPSKRYFFMRYLLLTNYTRIYHTARGDRMKQAKADAQELINAYRAEKQQEFNNTVLAAGEYFNVVISLYRPIIARIVSIRIHISPSIIPRCQMCK